MVAILTVEVKRDFLEELEVPRFSKARKALVDTMMKETIYEAAAAVLCKHGIQGTTMDRVAAAANVAKSSLYDYFESKDELLEFINTRLVEPFFQTMEEIADGDLPAPQKLEKILRASLERSDKERGIIRLLAETGQENQEIRRGIRPRFLRLLTGIFAQGIREGSFRPQNPANPGRMFLGCLSELFELQADDASSEEVHDYVEALIDATVNGFSIHAEKSSKSDRASPSSSSPQQST